MPDYEHQDSFFDSPFQVLRDAIGARVFPGCSLAVTNNGKLVALKSLGHFTYEPDSPEVLPASIFDLASLTKVVATSTMAMLLYERGLLDLDLPVAAIVPQFAADDLRRPEVTVRMLLAHSSGLPAYEKLSARSVSRRASACSHHHTAGYRSGHTRCVQRHRLHCPGCGAGKNCR